MNLEEMHYFATPVYVVQRPDFLDTIRLVSDRYVEASRDTKKTANYINLMTPSYSHEPELEAFSQYVSQTAWNILSSQGFNMDNMVTYFTEMWTQEHRFLSSMETHMHGAGCQISAFYFINAPAEGCKFVIHDPRPSKMMINLPETNSNNITLASSQIVFTPQPGTLIFANAWLPHSFTKNMSYDPVQFVHMNLSVSYQEDEQPSVEIV